MYNKQAPAMLKARKLLLEMFTTSRGHSIIDSGCAYGYASDTNKRLGLDQQPFLLKQDWETGWHGSDDKGVHISYLVNTLKYVEAFIACESYVIRKHLSGQLQILDLQLSVSLVENHGRCNQNMNGVLL